MTLSFAGYMAPEVGQLDEYDVRADTWSIGMTILELIFGERPFQQFEYEESAERVIQRVFTQGIELKIKEIYPDNGAKIEKELPEDLRRLICRCLQGDRDLRPKCQFLFTQPFLCNFEPSTRHIQKELLDQDVIVDADIIQKKKETEDCRSLGDHLFYPNGNYILFTFATWHNDKVS
jgi:serine/threonine protein kinase